VRQRLTTRVHLVHPLVSQRGLNCKHIYNSITINQLIYISFEE
jgi:hypothetical protein